MLLEIKTQHTMKNNPQGNIVRELPVDLVTNGDYEDPTGFFIRSAAGTIKYVPLNNQDDEVITKTVEAQAYFNDPTLCRKIVADGTTATGIYVGYGV